MIRGALDGPYLGEKTRRFSRRFDLSEPRGGGGFDAFLPSPDPLLVLDGTRDARAVAPAPSMGGVRQVMYDNMITRTENNKILRRCMISAYKMWKFVANL